MYFVKLRTSDGETRWVNLERVSRATLARDVRGDPILTVRFADGGDEDRLQIPGHEAADREAIDLLTAELDGACRSTTGRAAAAGSRPAHA
jgi:hypothetical protein